MPDLETKLGRREARHREVVRHERRVAEPREGRRTPHRDRNDANTSEPSEAEAAAMKREQLRAIGRRTFWKVENGNTRVQRGKRSSQRTDTAPCRIPRDERDAELLRGRSHQRPARDLALRDRRARRQRGERDRIEVTDVVRDDHDRPGRQRAAHVHLQPMRPHNSEARGLEARGPTDEVVVGELRANDRVNGDRGELADAPRTAQQRQAASAIVRAGTNPRRSYFGRSRSNVA